MLYARIGAGCGALGGGNACVHVDGIRLDEERAVVAVIQREVVMLSFVTLIRPRSCAGAVGRDLVGTGDSVGDDRAIDALGLSAGGIASAIERDLRDIRSRAPPSRSGHCQRCHRPL